MHWLRLVGVLFVVCMAPGCQTPEKPNTELQSIFREDSSSVQFRKAEELLGQGNFSAARNEFHVLSRLANLSKPASEYARENEVLASSSPTNRWNNKIFFRKGSTLDTLYASEIISKKNYCRPGCIDRMFNILRCLGEGRGHIYPGEGFSPGRGEESSCFPLAFARQEFSHHQRWVLFIFGKGEIRS